VLERDSRRRLVVAFDQRFSRWTVSRGREVFSPLRADARALCISRVVPSDSEPDPSTTDGSTILSLTDVPDTGFSIVSP
jgi:hypothetical protein